MPLASDAILCQGSDTYEGVGLLALDEVCLWPVGLVLTVRVTRLVVGFGSDDRQPVLINLVI